MDSGEFLSALGYPLIVQNFRGVYVIFIRFEYAGNFFDCGQIAREADDQIVGAALADESFFKDADQWEYVFELLYAAKRTGLISDSD